jgi:hypothetical protein
VSLYAMTHGVMRLYDGTGGSPFYLVVPFTDGNLSAPEGRARIDEKFVLDRGRGSVGVSAVGGVDDPILNPLTLSFSMRIQNDATVMPKLRLALSNPDLGAWSIGGNTWVTTKGGSTLTGGDGNTFSDPAFEDTKKFCVDVCILWTRAAVPYGRRYRSVFFPPEQQSVAESADGVVLSASGMIYGTVSAITAFPSGTLS